MYLNLRHFCWFKFVLIKLDRTDNRNIWVVWWGVLEVEGTVTSFYSLTYCLGSMLTTIPTWNSKYTLDTVGTIVINLKDVFDKAINNEYTFIVKTLILSMNNTKLINWSVKYCNNRKGTWYFIPKNAIGTETGLMKYPRKGYTVLFSTQQQPLNIQCSAETLNNMWQSSHFEKH